MENKNIDMYNHALLGILQREGTITGFLDVCFQFLSSKTDFFRVMKHEKQSFGFPPGKAKEMLNLYFDKYDKLVQDSEKELEKKAIKDQSQKNIINLPSKKTEEAKENKADRSKVDTQSEPLKELPKTQEEFQKSSDTYNGAARENYKWSQDYNDVDVKVIVPEYIKKSRQVKVDIQRKFISVAYEDETKIMKTQLQGEFYKEVKTQDTFWSLEPGKAIIITLGKAEKTWWKSLTTDEEEIDMQKISAECSMSEMSPEEQQAINKLKFDDHQKKLGLPQSHELKVHEMLKKGWNSEGSPFAGQKFDPSNFNISPSSISE